MSLLTFKPIGVIYSLFREAPGTPIQPAFAVRAQGMVEVFPDYADGLRDLAGFERIWLLYLFDRAGPARLRVVPFRDTEEAKAFHRTYP